MALLQNIDNADKLGLSEMISFVWERFLFTERSFWNFLKLLNELNPLKAYIRDYTVHTIPIDIFTCSYLLILYVFMLKIEDIKTRKTVLQDWQNEKCPECSSLLHFRHRTKRQEICICFIISWKQILNLWKALLNCATLVGLMKNLHILSANVKQLILLFKLSGVINSTGLKLEETIHASNLILFKTQRPQ